MTMLQSKGIEKVLIEIDEKLSKLVQEQEKIKAVLVGDEFQQRGIIQRVATLEAEQCNDCQKPKIEDHEKRIKDIEKKIIYFAGISTGASVIIGIIIKFI